jgi:hypothetical protein
MLRVRPRDLHPHPVAAAALVTILLIATVPYAAANIVEAISWDHDSSGHTTITIVCASPIDPSSFRTFPVTDPPRAVVVLKGITKPVRPNVMTIDDRHVIQLRLNHHEDRSPPELNVILDLKNETTRVLDLQHNGRRLVAVIGLPPLPTATPIHLSSPVPSPRPTRVPSTPTAVISPTNTPSYPDRAAPPVLPPTVATSAAVPSPTTASAHAFLTFPSPTPALDPETATRVVDISASLRSDGSTLLRITANGRLPHGCARTLEIADQPPRIVLTIQGISAPDLPRTISIGDPNLDRIRLIHDAETSTGELHLVLQLERAGVSVIELKQVGPHLVLQLAAP